jgi:hypothetical protein
MPTEADTCRRFVVPKLQAAGWDNEPYSIAEQRTITDGRIVPVGKGFVRRPSKRVDYLLRYRRDFPLAVVEAKPEFKTAADGLQQAKQYAEMLGLNFAYASNGPDTIEFDYFTGLEKTINAYPSPEELWRRFRNGKQLKDDTAAEQLLTPINFTLRQGERYYQLLLCKSLALNGDNLSLSSAIGAVKRHWRLCQIPVRSVPSHFNDCHIPASSPDESPMQRSRESMGYVEREPAQRYAFGNCGAALGRKARYVD